MIFRRKFHGILPEFRAMPENYLDFLKFAEKSWNSKKFLEFLRNFAEMDQGSRAEIKAR